MNEPFEAGPSVVAHVSPHGERAAPSPTGGPVSSGVPMPADGTESGYIKIFRKMKEWNLYADPAAFKIFMDILLHCRWEAGDVFVGGILVHLEAGQMVWGRLEAARRNGLSEKSTRGAADRLERGKCLKRAVHGAGKFTIITISNWETYQTSSNGKGHEGGQKRAMRGPGEGHERATKKKDKELEEGKALEEKKKQRPAAKKAAGSSPFRKFTDEWCHEWERVHKAKYPFQRKDGVAAAAIWEYAAEDMGTAVDIIERYLLDPSPFFQGHPLTKLASNLPQFAASDPNGAWALMEPKDPSPELLREFQEAGLAPK